MSVYRVSFDIEDTLVQADSEEEALEKASQELNDILRDAEVDVYPATKMRRGQALPYGWTVDGTPYGGEKTIEEIFNAEDGIPEPAWVDPRQLPLGLS